MVRITTIPRLQVLYITFLYKEINAWVYTPMPLFYKMPSQYKNLRLWSIWTLFFHIRYQTNHMNLKSVPQPNLVLKRRLEVFLAHFEFLKKMSKSNNVHKLTWGIINKRAHTKESIIVVLRAFQTKHIIFSHFHTK